jgi:hypothetical protein
MDNDMVDGWYNAEMVSYRDPKTFALIDKPKMIPLEAAIQVIANWWDKDPTFHWEKSPAWVINKMLEAVDDGIDDGQPLLIPYEKAVSILQQAETSKMDGPANKGMRYIKDEWKKLYLP